MLQSEHDHENMGDKNIGPVKAYIGLCKALLKAIEVYKGASNRAYKGDPTIGTMFLTLGATVKGGH